MKTRKVGTVTLGITLISFGLLFVIHLFTDMISYGFVIKLWPFIFISLGVEILIYHFICKEETYQYDFAAIFIIIILSMFATGMAAVEFVVNHSEWFREVYWRL